MDLAVDKLVRFLPVLFPNAESRLKPSGTVHKFCSRLRNLIRERPAGMLDDRKWARANEGFGDSSTEGWDREIYHVLERCRGDSAPRLSRRLAGHRPARVAAVVEELEKKAVAVCGRSAC